MVVHQQLEQLEEKYFYSPSEITWRNDSTPHTASLTH